MDFKQRIAVVAIVVIVIFVSCSRTGFIAQDAPTMPSEERYRLESINARIQLYRTQQSLLQVQYEKLQSDVTALEKEHEAAIVEAVQKLKLKPSDWTVDDTKTPYTYIRKAKPEAKSPEVKK